MLIGLLFLLVSVSALRPSKVGRGDNPEVQSVTILQKGYYRNGEYIKIRRGTEVYVQNIIGRCQVIGFTYDGSVCIRLPSGDTKRFNKSRITLCEPRRE